MSVLFLPPSAGAASIPDASETVSGKIRIATSAEATAGTNDLTAMTPAKTKSVVDAAVVGGVTYQGTFDASAPADLSNAEKGDLYIISVAGTYQGQTWAVGDHLLINADMGGTLDPAKIDKVDNTDSVTSVAGRTGAVTLSTADISGLATVASTGAYSDLTGAPTLATVATTGAYSDLTGTPTLGTAAAEDVGTSAGNVVQLDGTAKLPAVDGSQLTNLPSAPVTSVAGKTGAVTLVAGDISGLATVATTGAYSDLTGTPTLATVATTGAYSDLTGAPTLGTAAAEDVGTAAGNVVQLDGSARLPAVDGSQLTNLPSGASTLGALTDVDVTGAVNTNVLKYNSTSGNWEDGAVAYSEVTGTPTLATVATTGAYSDLSGTPTLATVATTGAYSDLTGTPTLGTAAAEDVGTLAGNVVQLDGSARLPAVDGSQLTNLPSGASTLGALTDVDVTGAVNTNVLKYNSTSGSWEDGAVAYAEVTGTPTLATVATTGAYSDLTGAPTLATVATTGAYSDLSGTPTLGTAAALDVGTSANNVVQLNGSAQLPAVDGSLLTGVTSSVGALNDVGDVTITTPSNGQALIYNSTSGDWENGTVSATVASLNDIGDVSAASPSTGDLLEWNGSSWVTVARFEVVTTVTTSTALTVPELEQLVRTSGSGITLTLPNIASNSIAAGVRYQVKVTDSNTVTISPNGTELLEGVNSSYTTGGAKEALTVLCDGSGWWFV